MPIPSEHTQRCIYHFTHISNLPSLLRHGILANNHPDFSGIKCTSIAEHSIQIRRSSMVVTCPPGGFVHDYVPLYFGSLSPMLLGVIQKKNVDQVDILYLEFPISLVDRPDVVFTDASANTNNPPNFYTDPKDLSKLNWAEIDSLKWGSATDALRHQRMAEVLVHSSLKIQDARRIVVWNGDVKNTVEAMAREVGVNIPSIEHESRDRKHYFTKFMFNRPTESLITGPRILRLMCDKAVEYVKENSGKNPDAAFPKLKDLLLALRKDFGCIPHTAELVDLKTDNAVHTETVDVHTLQVVEKLKALDEFANLPSGEDRARLELAAYLHDIGKGPKSRWANNGGIQKADPDHPAEAIPMMAQILTEEVQTVRQPTAELLIKLVAYHDLVGEVVGKGRDEKQILDVAGSKLELDMLFALGKADTISIAPLWWNEQRVAKLYARCLSALGQAASS